MKNKYLTKKYRSLLRKNRDRDNRKRLNNEDITIISANCVGGVILHDLGLNFKTPTINLYFDASDYVKFVKNLKYYLNCELVVTDSDYNYPCALCGDLVLHMVHYKSFEFAKKKWEERCKRINFDNIYFIMSDRDGCTYEDILEFDRLDYEHKVFLTYKERPEIQCAVCIPDSEDNGIIRDVCQYKSKFTGERWIDGFDYISFLNS